MDASLDTLIRATQQRLFAALGKEAKDQLVHRHHLDEIDTLTRTLDTLFHWSVKHAHVTDELFAGDGDDLQCPAPAHDGLPQPRKRPELAGDAGPV